MTYLQALLFVMDETVLVDRLEELVMKDYSSADDKWYSYLKRFYELVFLPLLLLGSSSINLLVSSKSNELIYY